MIKLKALLVVRRIVSWQILCMDKCLLPNIEALYINSPVPPCDCRRKCTATMPLLVYVSFSQNHAHFCVRSSLSFLNRVNAETKRHSKQQKLSARCHAREHQFELRMRSNTWNEVWTRYTTSTARTVSYRNYHGERRLFAHADRRPEVSSYVKSSGKSVKSAGCFLQLAILRPTNLCSR